jgi:hypothetical protein
MDDEDVVSAEEERHFNMAQAEMIQRAEDQIQVFYNLDPDALQTMYLLFNEIGSAPDQFVPQMVMHWMGIIRGISVGRDKVDPAMQLVSKTEMQALLVPETENEAGL